ncbi:MAG: MBL fold metallo-hydrolase [Polaromonas sp.]|uniref:MBL fold metallo-hydrolase n=1 Tax=Polaromonas sp. TaxID=1869339 RepID=UPI0027369375|nr:MBL fold metallo-hydrolase [Polaromonas sp.]MDP2035271.1 MBL fold metallo-hydrolase [Polaromonas sp.]MDP2818262.1 MBL fold metallo-hydrolase [Polaromonas sp.]
MINRRDLLVGGGAAAAAYLAGSFVPLVAQNAPNFGAPSVVQVGYRRQQMGDMEVIALNDGVTRRPLAAEFVRNTPLDQVQALLRSQNLPTDYIDVPYTAFLIVMGNRRVLIDTGFSDNGGPTTGRLVSNLNAAGYKVEDIDTVILSHFHGDHINGVRNKAGQLVFPNAKIMVPTVEYDFWMDDARMAAAPEAMKGAFANVRRVMGGLGADRLVKFVPGTEIIRGANSLKSVAAFGHTPGHTLFVAQSYRFKFAYLADLTNIPQLFARNPDMAVVFDMDAAAAREVRRKVFEMTVQENMTAGGFHFPFPAFGRIEKLGNGYDFKPVA